MVFAVLSVTKMCCVSSSCTFGVKHWVNIEHFSKFVSSMNCVYVISYLYIQERFILIILSLISFQTESLITWFLRLKFCFLGKAEVKKFACYCTDK